MPNCPVCGGVYAAPAGKVVNSDHKTITVCQKCYLDKSKFNKYVNEKNYEAAANIYETWENQLDNYFKDDNISTSLLDGFFAREGSSDEVDKILLERRQQVLDRKKQVAESQKQAEEHRQKICNFMMTSGYNFEGYRIIEYHKVVSASTVLGTGLLSEVSASFSDAFGVTSNAFELKMDKAKEISHQKLAAVADSVGANAVIGVDFDYLTLGNNMIAVSANGTAVTIEKKD